MVRASFLFAQHVCHLNDRRQRESRERTESYVCGRKGHWSHDYECTMSQFSLFPEPQTRTARMTTQQRLSSQPKKATKCFVLDDCGDDSETFANRADGKVSFSMEPTKQTSLTPIAFNAIDRRVGNILDVHTADDDGSWSNEDDSRMERTAVC